MQPTAIQVQLSREALERGTTLALPASRGGTTEVPLGLADALVRMPPVRPERITDARLRLAAGDGPTDDDLADRMVGRLVCDRLR